MTRLLDELREDLGWLNLVDGRPRPAPYGWCRIVSVCWLARGPKAVLLYRLSHRLHRNGWRRLAAILSAWAFRTCHAEISPAARIGGGLRMPHPQGIIIGSAVEIGRFVTIGQHVTIGGSLGRRDADGRFMPRISDEAMILAGSVVAGPVFVGSRSIIAANSVVTHSLPPNVVAGGAPARILKTRQPAPALAAIEA